MLTHLLTICACSSILLFHLPASIVFTFTSIFNALIALVAAPLIAQLMHQNANANVSSLTIAAYTLLRFHKISVGLVMAVALLLACLDQEPDCLATSTAASSCSAADMPPMDSAFSEATKTTSGQDEMALVTAEMVSMVPQLLIMLPPVLVNNCSNEIELAPQTTVEPFRQLWMEIPHTSLGISDTPLQPMVIQRSMSEYRLSACETTPLRRCLSLPAISASMATMMLLKDASTSATEDITHDSHSLATRFAAAPIITRPVPVPAAEIQQHLWQFIASAQGAAQDELQSLPSPSMSATYLKALLGRDSDHCPLAGSAPGMLPLCLHQQTDASTCHLPTPPSSPGIPPAVHAAADVTATVCPASPAHRPDSNNYTEMTGQLRTILAAMQCGNGIMSDLTNSLNPPRSPRQPIGAQV
ncbi:hypothetical protein RI367_005336 [Sorochytrium milnesiophthora]